ncbi:allophanate hydrolase subunit 1 [Vibrio lamellibrachiae]|uniref:5-oxoprolinase subunit B family protein n=1 Tax=Vibrio lamellibrachiae TaxID=2910253 RepID=UPI003D0A0CA7
MSFPYTIEPIAECSLLIKFNVKPSNELSLYIGSCARVLSDTFPDWLMNITPSYCTILVDYLPHRVSMDAFIPLLEKSLEQVGLQKTSSDPIILLPAFYDPSVGPDLDMYFKDGLTLDDVITFHTQQVYTVSAIGFTAGFAFLTDVHPALQKPRLPSPRLEVPQGSIAIANNQTAVYPDQSPGGWNIIGNCPYELYNPNKEPMTPFSIGATVQFTSISKDKFIALGGKIPCKERL